MISQALAVAVPVPATPVVTAEQPDGDFFDIVMLQLHVTMASAWLILAVVVALMAVPRLRRIPSALGLHALQVRRGLLSSVLWSLYLMALSTGIYLMFQQAAYDPEWPGGDQWTGLEAKPYASPHFYALYTKIGLFALMGLATYVLSREAKKASKESEAAGGPVEVDLYADTYDDDIYPTYGTTKLTTYAAAMKKTEAKKPKRTVHVVPLWMSVGVMLLGSVGIAFCITLIKYFHELSKSAVVYEILKLKGGG